MTISLCMIVKNEESTLERCLKSVRGCFDEIIIVDTGSSDKTPEIARQFTPHVHKFIWCNDFSAARNHSFSYATSDYVMWLDADDVLTEDNRQLFLNFKKTINGSVDRYTMFYATAYDESGHPTFYFTRERLVKRSTQHKWIGRVHETLFCDGKTEHTNIFIFHQSIKKTYSKRNLDIFELQLRTDGFLHPRDMFYYARELYYHKLFPKAITTLKSYLYSCCGWLENRLDAYLFLSKCYEEIGDSDMALIPLFSSMKEAPPRANICCEIGRLFMNLANISSAIYWFELALQLPVDIQSGGFINSDYNAFIPYLQLCVCYFKTGDVLTAKRYHELAKQLRPTSPAVLFNEAFFSASEQNP